MSRLEGPERRRPYRHGARPHFDVGPAQPQQLLGVLSGWRGLVDGGLALGGESGEQDGPLHLGAGDGRRVIDAPQGAAPDGQRRKPAALAAIDVRPHPTQGIRHPVHGPAGDRLVTGQHREPVQGRGPTGQQPDPGPGVADVDHPGRLAQPSRAAVDHDLPPGGRRRYVRPEGPDGCQGVPNVLTGRQAGQAGPTVRPGRQEQGPMGDGLVAGDAEAAVHATPTGNSEELRHEPSRRIEQRNCRSCSTSRTCSVAAASITSTSTPRSPSALWAISRS